MSGTGVEVVGDSAFDDLTERQVEALCNVAFGGQGGGCGPRTLASLVKRGLIERVAHRQRQGNIFFTVTKHEMPLHVHIAFCDWCSRQKLLFMDDEP